MYTEISIDNDYFKNYEIGNGRYKTIQNLNKINIIIGQNNSGKSRFIRKIFANEFKFQMKEIPFNRVVDELLAFKTLAQKSISNFQVVPGINNNLAKINDNKFIDESFDISDTYTILNLIVQATGPYQTNQMPLEVALLANNMIDQLNRIMPNDYKEELKIKKIYIPTLRGLKSLSDNNDSENDVYKERVIKDYFLDFSNYERRDIYTGLSLYEDVKELLLGNTEDRNKIRDFELFLGDTFFPGEELNIVPNIHDDVVHIRIGDVERPIYELGEGIQAIIILTYPLFFNRDKKMVVCIEEPETYLHPGFQRLFVETIKRKEFDNFQFFITTHSNHFLDITVDIEGISVYTIKKADHLFYIENVEADNKNILQLIGARSSSVFLSNCTIWVEGITDRLYLKKYFEIYQYSQKIKYREDYHFSFVEYGGNNITHWSFLDSEDTHANINVDKLCSTLFLITDNDGAGLTKDGNPNQQKLKKYERFMKLTNKLGNRYCCLKSREIENLLSRNVLIQVIEDYEGDKSKSLDFSKFDESKIQLELLGAYINKTVQGIKRNYSADSGTISDKVNFCKKSISFIDSIDDLSEEAKEICEKLYNFIKSNN